MGGGQHDGMRDEPDATRAFRNRTADRDFRPTPRLLIFSEKLRLRVAFARRVVDCPDGGGLTHAPLVGWF